MEIIISKTNSLIKEIKKLHERKYRNLEQKFLIEGYRFVREAIIANADIDMILLEEDFEEKVEKFEIADHLKNYRLQLVSKSIMKHIAGTENPQGILALVNNKSQEIKNTEGFYILCDKIQDPGNIGTIIRTAHATGALGVILTKGTVDIYNDKALRSTMGSIFYVPIINEDDSFSNIKLLKEKGFSLVSSSLDTDNNFYDLDFTKKTIIAVGNEGNGISDEVFEISDQRFKIPMPGGAESLNVGIATSVIAFEVVRQKQTAK